MTRSIFPLLTVCLIASQAATAAGPRCGSERWDIKTASDSEAIHIAPGATDDTILHLVWLVPPKESPRRIAPLEYQRIRLRDVLLVAYKREADQDYHLILEDAQGHELTVEIPDPRCAKKSHLDLVTPRATFDRLHHVSTAWTHTREVITVEGIGFWDHDHGQRGAANGVELHPVTAICTGKGCTP